MFFSGWIILIRNKYMNKVLKNLSYTLLSNIVSFVISALVTFVVPKQLGVENYSYFQLYLFYLNFTGFFHFGWADGVFLRYGGAYYEKLNKEKFSGQFRLYFLLELVISTLIGLIAYFLVPESEKTMVFLLLGISVILLLPRTLLQYILQGTNRIREYANLVMIDKFVYIIAIMVVLFVKVDDFVPIILADLLGKLVALIYAIYQCRDLVFHKAEDLQSQFREAWQNISVGIKLTFAAISSMLIIGIVRQAIEIEWDVATFGKISLTMSVSNLLMLLIRAVAMIMFPMLRRMDEEKLPSLYSALRTVVMIPLLGMLILYYPMKQILSLWLPQYQESLVYMALLFPICIYESKMSMIVETYMKALRKEKQLLLVNVLSVVLSLGLTGLTVFYLESLELAVLTIVVLLAFRCIYAEMLLAKALKVPVLKDIIQEVVLTILFIVFSWNIGGMYGLLLYMLVYAIYLGLQRNAIKNLWGMVKNRKLD